MKTSKRGVLVAALLGVSMGLVLLSSLAPAKERPLGPTLDGKAVRGVGTLSNSRVTTSRRIVNQDEESLVIAASEGQITLGDSPVYVPFTSAVSGTGKGIKLASRLETLGLDRRIYLVLRGVRAYEAPGILYNVYLDAPKDARPEKKGPNHVGILNFYDAVVPQGDSSAENFSRNRSYDVTALVRNLASQKLLTDCTTVTIVPSGRPTLEARAVIERIELLER